MLGPHNSVFRRFLVNARLQLNVHAFKLPANTIGQPLDLGQHLLYNLPLFVGLGTFVFDGEVVHDGG